ncbi:MAG: hypothetical protein OXT69_07705 [Candidatus Poribacteria bacterium]|nr:hypothetical protein [Candidatus Poribacteria bacterium]
MIIRKTIICLLASAVMILGAGVASAVSVSSADGVWMIETDGYTVHFKEAAQAGYSQAIASGESLFGAGQGRNFYHSSNYGGWRDWGAAAEVSVVEEGAGYLVMKYVMNDGGSKLYHVTATYWDGVPYFKHELAIEASAALASLSNGHEPMVEPRNGKGAENQYMLWEDPFHHVAFANGDGYFAMYTENGTAAMNDAWNVDGRMHLIHDNLSQDLTAGQTSDPIAFYMAVGSGGLDDAHTLADSVTDVPTSVDPAGKLTSTWAAVKTQ